MIVQINEKDWTYIGKYNYAAKWCRSLCSYYLEKTSDKTFKRIQNFNWFIYSLLFIPVHLLQAIVLLWDGGLKEFILFNRSLGYDVLTKGSAAFARAEEVWQKNTANDKKLKNIFKFTIKKKR